MKIACYTDIHNQQVMLNYPTVLRKSAIIAAENTLKEFGKAEIKMYILLTAIRFSLTPHGTIVR